MKKLIVGVIVFLMTVNIFGSYEEYKKAVDLDGNSVVKRFNLGLAYYNAGEHDNAISTMKKVLEMNSGDTTSHEKVDFTAAQILGIVYFNFKNNDIEAIKYFKKATELNSVDGSNYFYMGLAYLRQEKYEDAIAALKSSLEKDFEEEAEASYRLGYAYYKKKRYADAIKYFEAAIDIKPKHMEAHEFLGLIFHEREKSKKAIEHFKTIVKVNPENFNIQYLLGLNYFKQKKYDKMKIAYKKAITINPNFADAHYNLGMAYYYSSLYKEAIDELEIAKKLNPGDSSTFSLLAQARTAASEYYLSQGTTYLTEEEYLKARESFELALMVNKNDSEARKYLQKAKDAIRKEIPVYLKNAKSSYDAGKFSEAYSAWDYVAQVDPKNSEAADGLKKLEKNMSKLIAAKEKQALDYIAQTKYEEAINEYRALKKVVPRSKQDAINTKIKKTKAKRDAKIDKVLTLANKYYTGKDKKIKKDYKKSLAKYNEVLKYEPKNEDALNGITKVNQKIQDDKEKYLALAKQNKKSNAEKAKKYYKKVLVLDPSNTVANAQMEKITGKKSTAAVDAKQIKSLYYEGVDKYVNGEIEQAIKVWKKVLKLDGAHAEAKKNISRATKKLAAIKSLTR